MENRVKTTIQVFSVCSSHEARHGTSGSFCCPWIRCSDDLNQFWIRMRHCRIDRDFRSIVDSQDIPAPFCFLFILCCFAQIPCDELCSSHGICSIFTNGRRLVLYCIPPSVFFPFFGRHLVELLLYHFKNLVAY